MPIEDATVGVGLQTVAKIINDGTRERLLAMRRSSSTRGIGV
ncbi:MAG: hypothetical protein AB8F26_10735 [Phycisphaerales bacterium]